MKNNKLFMISIVGFGLLLFSTNTFLKTISTEKENIEGVAINTSMSFNIALDRTKFYQLEPIGIKCRFSNETNQSQTTLIPSFISESRLEVNFEGESKQFNTISIYRILLRREPVTFV